MQVVKVVLSDQVTMRTVDCVNLAGRRQSPLFISSSAIALPHLDGSDLKRKLEGRDR